MTHFYWLKSLFLFHEKSLQQPLNLLEGDLFHISSFLWPLKFHPFKMFLACQYKTIFIIAQDFDRSFTFIAKEEHTLIGERIQLELKMDHCNKSVDLFTKIGRTAGNVNVSGILCKMS